MLMTIMLLSLRFWPALLRRVAASLGINYKLEHNCHPALTAEKYQKPSLPHLAVPTVDPVHAGRIQAIA
jgi:hypothetical protein